MKSRITVINFGGINEVYIHMNSDHKIKVAGPVHYNWLEQFSNISYCVKIIINKNEKGTDLTML